MLSVNEEINEGQNKVCGSRINDILYIIPLFIDQGQLLFIKKTLTLCVGYVNNKLMILKVRTVNRIQRIYKQDSSYITVEGSNHQREPPN